MSSLNFAACRIFWLWIGDTFDDKSGRSWFRRMKTLQKFASIHAKVYNHFNLERHLIDRETYKERLSAAPAE